MHDFFQRQDAARRKTALLVWLFLLAVIIIVPTVHVAVVTVLIFTTNLGMRAAPYSRILLDTAFLRLTVPTTLGVIVLGSVYKFIMLRHGGQSVAEMLGARLAPPDTADPYEKRLLNVVEEMAIASGLPVPLVFILERESSINAFAAGFTPDDAVIAVTRGAVDLLSRDELQGVMAHEFSHIANGDMLLNIRLMGLLHGILLIHLTGDAMLRRFEGPGSVHAKRSAPAIAIGLVLYFIGLLGAVTGWLIKAAVSRQREYLADAAAVQFTRNPLGLSGALKKIGGLSFGSIIHHPRAAEASHLYFGDGLNTSLFSLFSTHPPLAERVRLLDPAFDGTFPKVKRIGEEIPVAVARPRYRPAAPAREEDQAASAAVPEATVSAAAASTTILPAPFASPTREHMTRVRLLLKAMPDQLREGCRTPAGSRAAVLALLLHKEDPVRSRQLEILAHRQETEVLSEVERLAPFVSTLTPEAKLPLVDLSLPALRLMTPAQYEAFHLAVTELANADQRVSPFEYVLHVVLLKHLRPAFKGRKKTLTRLSTLSAVIRECACVIAFLARAGHDTEVDARAAFVKAFTRLLPRGEESPGLPPAEAAALGDFDRALKKLSAASPAIKSALLAACEDCLIHDGRIQAAEAALFRAVADSLDCPLPPWLGRHTTHGG